MRYNKKLGSKQREAVIMDCQQKLKRDYMNYFDYVSFFEEEYLIQDRENRENLKIISEKLIKINDTANY